MQLLQNKVLLIAKWLRGWNLVQTSNLRETAISHPIRLAVGNFRCLSQVTARYGESAITRMNETEYCPPEWQNYYRNSYNAHHALGMLRVVYFGYYELFSKLSCYSGIPKTHLWHGGPKAVVSATKAMLWPDSRGISSLWSLHVLSCLRATS